MVQALVAEDAQLWVVIWLPHAINGKVLKLALGFCITYCLRKDPHISSDEPCQVEQTERDKGEEET